jgi:hypothetical protein
MVSGSTNRSPKGLGPCAGIGVPAYPTVSTGQAAENHPTEEPSQGNDLQALLALSALQQQVYQRRTMASRHAGDVADVSVESKFKREQFVLDEVLQLVADRALAITSADGLVIGLAENTEIVLRAAAGTTRPDIGTPLDRDSAFSGACFSSAQIGRCDDTETDTRINLQACRRLGVRSIVAVPLCGRQRVIGLLEAFSAEPFKFSDGNVLNLMVLADLVVQALNPEEEDRFAACAQLAATKLEAPSPTPEKVRIGSLSPGGAPLEPSTAAPVIAEPSKMEVPSAIDPRILHQPQFEPEKSCSEFTATAMTEIAAEPAVAAEESDSASRGPTDSGSSAKHATKSKSGRLVWLVCVVIAAVLAAAAWWSLKKANLNYIIVPEQKTSVRVGTTSERDHATNSSKTPRAALNFPRVTEIRYWAAVDSTTVVVSVEDQVQYETKRLTGPDRIYFDLHSTLLASNVAAKIEVRDPLLKRIRVGQPAAGVTRIVLVTEDRTDFSVRVEPNPYQLVVELRKSGGN